MDARFQRAREYTERGGERRSSGTLLEVDENLHDWIRGLLEPEERLIMPEDFVENWEMYDQVCGWGWLIKDRNAEDPEAIDFAWDSDLRRMEKSGKDISKITVIDKVMIVRVRTPWNSVNTEWLATEVDMEENGEDLEILEIYIRARKKNEPNSRPKMLVSHKNRRAYEAAPEEYEVTEKKYLVAYKTSPESRMKLLR
jgi:hypothetical protein